MSGDVGQVSTTVLNQECGFRYIHFIDTLLKLHSFKCLFILFFFRLEINYTSSCNNHAFILALDVDTNRYTQPKSGPIMMVYAYWSVESGLRRRFHSSTLGYCPALLGAMVHCLIFSLPSSTCSYRMK